MKRKFMKFIPTGDLASAVIQNFPFVHESAIEVMQGEWRAPERYGLALGLAELIWTANNYDFDQHPNRRVKIHRFELLTLIADAILIGNRMGINGVEIVDAGWGVGGTG